MDFTFRYNIILLLLVSNLLFLSTGNVQGERIRIQEQLEITQDDFDFDLGNLTQDLLESLANIIWKGDGTGLTEIIWNLLPIVGNNNDTNALLFPIFLILFTGGVYTMLKKQGVID